MRRTLFVALALSWYPVVAYAQTPVINPTAVDFTVSPDHNALRIDGTPVLTRYEMVAVAMNVTGALVWTQDIGKPAPNAQNLATVALPPVIPITAETLYTATVASLGPDCGGAGQPACNKSVASNPFGIAGTRVPGAASNVRVR